MSSNPILSDRDVNAPVAGTGAGDNIKDASSAVKPAVSALEYHRQVLQSKLSDDKSNQQYVSPSDNIMSPCTAKLSAYRSKHFKAKPQSLFGKATSNGLKASPSSSQSSTNVQAETKDGEIESGTDDSHVESKDSSPAHE